MESQPAPAQRGIYCSACGHLNPSWHSECEECKTKLVSPDKLTYSALPRRPGCVTAYAVLLAIVTGLGALWGIAAGIGLMVDTYGSTLGGLLVIVASVVIAVLYFLLAGGLWRQRNWARTIVIVLQGLGLLINGLSMCGTLTTSLSGPYGYQSSPTPAICGGIVGLTIGGYILYWFASHGEYFD